MYCERWKERWNKEKRYITRDETDQKEHKNKPKFPPKKSYGLLYPNPPTHLKNSKE